MISNIRFGILGSGFMGQTHAAAILGRPDAELIAISGGSRAPSLAAQHKAAFEESTGSLVARPDIDAVIVATPHYVHIDQALAAIENGKHVLVEKPMATSVEDCDRMIEAAERRGVALSLVYQQRFRLNNMRAYELVRSGAIGAISTFQISMPLHLNVLQSGGFGSTWEWWTNPASVGHVLNAAPHAVDLMRWLTGAEVVTVSAFSRTFRPYPGVEDTTFALFQFSGSEFSNEMIGSLFSSCALPAANFPGEDFRFRIVGTRGLLDLDPYHDLRIADESGWHTVSTQPPVGYEDSKSAFGDARMAAYRSEITEFMKAVRGQPSGEGKGPDGRAGVQAVLAMLTSSRERRWVDLPTRSAVKDLSKAK